MQHLLYARKIEKGTFSTPLTCTPSFIIDQKHEQQKTTAPATVPLLASLGEARKSLVLL